MKRKKLPYTIVLPVLLLFFLVGISSIAQTVKVELTPGMVTNESGEGNATKMVDEQIVAGDPLAGNGGSPETVWTTSYGSTYPLSAYIDFGQEIDLEHIYIFDYNAIADLIVEYGEPGNWSYLLTEPLSRYKSWRQHDVSVSTRYLRFVKTSANSNFGEVVIYANNPPPLPPVISDLTVTNSLTNSVSLQWTCVEGNDATGTLTSYDLRYSTDSITESNFISAQQFATGIVPEPNTVQEIIVDGLTSNTKYYFAIKAIGDAGATSISNIVSAETVNIQKVELFSYMVTNESGEGDAALMVDEQEFAGDPLNGAGNSPETVWSTSYGASYPLSAYIDFGMELELKHIFLFDYNASADLNIEYGEPGNWSYLLTEPLDKYKNWKQHDVSVTTRYIRIVKTSASCNFSEILVYANDPGALPPGISDLEATDTQADYVELTWTGVEGNQATGTLNAYDLRYSTDTITEENFADAVQATVGLSPEPYVIQEAVVNDLAANTTYYFAIKAMGNNGSTAISNVVGTTTKYFNNQVEMKLQLSPDMVVNETGMGLAGNIVDEQDLAGDPLSGTAGSPVNEWYPSTSLDDYPVSVYIDFGKEVTLSKVFIYDYYSIGDLVVEYGEPGNWQYLFTDPLTKYKTWKRHDVEVSTSYLRFTKMHREAKFSEIVLYGYLPEAGEEKIPLDVSMIDNVSGYGDAWTLVDEQEIAGDPLNSPGGNPDTYWETGFNSSIPYPLHCILDMRKIYDLSNVFIRDRNNSDEFRIYAGYPDNWELIVVDNLSGYLSWNQHELNANARYLKIEKSSARANVSEIVLYGYDNSPGFVDSIPPNQIVDLTAVPLDKNRIRLSWTAPGGNLANGLADFYQIYFDSRTFDETGLGDVQKWATPPPPVPTGRLQEITINNLTPDTRYYFAVRAADGELNFSEISNIADAKTNYQIGGDPYKFTITNDMLLNISAWGDAELMIDEQVSDPKNKKGQFPVTCWDPGSYEWKYPAHAIIDLKGQCLISEIYVFDPSDQNYDTVTPVTIYKGEPFNWSELLTDELDSTDIWKQHIVDVKTRYLRIELDSENSRFNELILYGTRVEEPIEEPLPQAYTDTVIIDQMMGVNAFVNDPVGRMKAAGFVREYHNWSWCEGSNNTNYPGYPNNQNDFNTLGWNFDYFYQSLKGQNITVCPDIQGNVLWLTGFNYSKLQDKPLLEGDDPLNPASYAAHADHMFQYAARYGSQMVADSLLKLAEEEYRISGSNLIRYYEDWNEQNKWWEGRDAYFTPYEYAAMASADYDGHMQTMGTTLGIKNADQNAKMVMGGLAGLNLDYIKGIKLWADHHRNGSVPFDVINVHHYCNANGVGISPEEDNLKERMVEFVEYRNTYMPDKEVWVTEFGYDTHPESVQRAPEIGSFSQEEVQAQWLVRSYLALAAAGVDKAVMYMLRDVNPDYSTKYCTSGLISSRSTGNQPKPSWYYVYTMKNRLTNMVFDEEIPSGNSNVMVYRFKHVNEDVAMYAVWCPTSDQTTVENYELSLGENELMATLIELTEGSVTGEETVLEVSDQKIVINVIERPVFVKTFHDELPQLYPSPEYKLVLDSAMVVNETDYSGAYMMADEQELSGDPFMGSGGSPQTGWAPGFGADYPCSAYVDLGSLYDISMIYIRDMNASDDVIFSIGEPGNWTTVCAEDLKRYKTWSSHSVNQHSRYLRVTLTGPNANFNELLIYVRD